MATEEKVMDATVDQTAQSGDANPNSEAENTAKLVDILKNADTTPEKVELPTFHKAMETLRGIHKELPEPLQLQLVSSLVQSASNITKMLPEMQATVSLESVQDNAWKKDDSYTILATALKAGGLEEGTAMFEAATSAAKAQFIQSSRCPKEVPQKRWHIRNSIELAEIGPSPRQRAHTASRETQSGTSQSAVRVKDLELNTEGQRFDIMWRAYKELHKTELEEVMAPATELPNTFYGGKADSNTRGADIYSRHLDKLGVPDNQRRGHLQAWGDKQTVIVNGDTLPRFPVING